MSEEMEIFLFVGFLVGGVVFFLLYCLIWMVKQQKKCKTEPQTPAPAEQKIKATVIDQYCAVQTIGYKTPKTVKIFTVVFKTDNGILRFDIPEEMYDGFEKGQTGLLTIAGEDLYSFVLDENPA